MHLEKYGGHTMAAGFTIRRDKFDAFRAAFLGVAAERLTPDDLAPSQRMTSRPSSLLEEFESVEHRNQLFPGSETPSLEAARWIETHQEVVTAWNALIASEHLTHYELCGGSPSIQPCS